VKTGLLVYLMMVCHGAFEYRTGDPGSLFPIQGAVHDYSFPYIMTSPALLYLADGFIFSSYAGKPYSEKELTSAGSALQYGCGEYGVQFSWNSFGTDFYREHTFSLKGGYSLFPFLHLGISGNLYLLKISTNVIAMDKKAYDTDLALLFTPFHWLNAGIMQSGVVSLFNHQNDDFLYRERSAGILVKPGRGFSLTWNMTDTASERENTFTATINPAPFFSVSGGYCHENSSFASSIGILAKNIFVSYGLKYHPYLGYTHSIGITFALHPVIESIDYGKPLFPAPLKKVNIQSATPDDLKKIDGLTGLSADRIILYREKIGPLSEKALIQIGLTGDEKKALEENIYGLERSIPGMDHDNNRKSKKKKFVKKPPRNERIKLKFRKLINAGIPASKAFSYSELSESGRGADFFNILHNDNSLNEEQKKIIGKACTE